MKVFGFFCTVHILPPMRIIFKINSGFVASVWVILFFILSFWGISSAGELKKKSYDDIILGVKGGYSLFEGYYKSRFSGSYCAGLSALYSRPALIKYLMAEMEIAYSRYPLKESKSSYLWLLSVNLGPLFYWPVISHFQVYAGVSGQGSYVFLHTSRFDRNEKAFKPGLLAKAGAFFPIRLGFRIRAGAEYSLHYLSNKPLHGFNFIGGVYYNFNPAELVAAPERIVDASAQIDWYLTLGNKALQKGDVEEAKAGFSRVLAIDPNNGEAREKLDGIRSAESDYARAQKLIEAKQYYDALPLLESAGKYLVLARTDRDKLRKEMAGEIALLEKKGIELYEKGDYRSCSAVMKRLLLIDPNNRTGLIYLPRALKRQEALERLR